MVTLFGDFADLGKNSANIQFPINVYIEAYIWKSDCAKFKKIGKQVLLVKLQNFDAVDIKCFTAVKFPGQA